MNGAEESAPSKEQDAHQAPSLERFIIGGPTGASVGGPGSCRARVYHAELARQEPRHRLQVQLRIGVNFRGLIKCGSGPRQGGAGNAGAGVTQHRRGIAGESAVGEREAAGQDVEPPAFFL